jgi:hypothetical protein
MDAAHRPTSDVARGRQKRVALIPDAGIKLAEDDTPATVAKKPGTPESARYKP